MFDFFKKLFSNQNLAAVKEAAELAKAEESSEKAVKTRLGESYVAITKVSVDPENPGAGAFELDWNDKFVADLIRHGYMKSPDDTDADIVERWFNDTCRNVVKENFENEMSDPERRAEITIASGRTLRD